MRSRVPWQLVACCCFATACVEWCDIGGGGDDNAETNNNATMSTNNGSTQSNNSTIVVDCVPGVFPQTVPYGAGDALPFAYEIPAAYGRVDESTPQEVAGVVFARRDDGTRDELAHHYRVFRTPATDASDLVAGWEATGGTAVEVAFDTGLVDGWLFERDDHDELRFLIVVDGDDYEVTLNWESPVGCDDGRDALRELATTSLQMNTASSFPD